jgi:phenylalanyl-tRNA synthetase alpha subunit
VQARQEQDNRITHLHERIDQLVTDNQINAVIQKQQQELAQEQTNAIRHEINEKHREQSQQLQAIFEFMQRSQANEFNAIKRPRVTATPEKIIPMDETPAAPPEDEEENEIEAIPFNLETRTDSFSPISDMEEGAGNV